jgi:hypothetical protein
MPHSNTITDRYRIKFERGTAGLADSILNSFCHLIEMNMARHYFTEAVGNSDERLVDIAVLKAARVKQTSVRGPLEALFNCITFHSPVSPKTIDKVIYKNRTLDSNLYLIVNKEKSLFLDRTNV